MPEHRKGLPSRLASVLLWSILVWGALSLYCADVFAESDWWAEGWSALIFAGPMTTDGTTDEIFVGEFDFEDAALAGVGITKRLLSVTEDLSMEAEAQVGRYFGDQDVFVLNGLVLARWDAFPWDHYIDTTFAVGDGLSYAFDVPDLEAQAHPESAKLLNLVVLELGFALPTDPDWQFLFRFHHRSGMFGLIDDVREGSSVLAVGVRHSY